MFVEAKTFFTLLFSGEILKNNLKDFLQKYDGLSNTTTFYTVFHFHSIINGFAKKNDHAHIKIHGKDVVASCS